MKNFGISGLVDHWQSTLAGILGIAVAFGLLTQDQLTAIMGIAPQIVGGITAVVSLIALFYKGK